MNKSKKDKLFRPDIRISEYCEQHNDQKIDSWCPEHETGVCKICIETDHKECSGIEHISGESIPTESDNEVLSVKQMIINIRKVYKSLQEERKSNVESLNTQKAQIREQIRLLRENLNQHLMKLENELVDELDRKCGNFISKLEEEITDYKYRSALLNTWEEESKKAREYGSNLQVFLSEKQKKSMANKEENQLKNLKIKNFSVELKISDAVKQILNQTSLGSVENIEADSYVDTEPLKEKALMPIIKLPRSKTLFNKRDEHRWDRTRLKRQREFIMDTSIEKLVPEVTGSTFMPDDSIILADAAHKRLLHVDNKGHISEEIPLSFEPFDVAVLGNSKLYISMANDRRVEIWDIKKMQQVDELFLPSNVSGINSYQDHLVAVVCEKTGLYLIGSDNSVNIISMTHNEEGPIDINADTICYAEAKKSLVHAFTHLGNRKFTVNVEGFGYIHGIALLKDNSILVAKFSPGRHSVFHISKDGREKMLRLELNNISSPRTFAVDRLKRKILLVHGVRKISIFQEI